MSGPTPAAVAISPGDQAAGDRAEEHAPPTGGRAIVDDWAPLQREMLGDVKTRQRDPHLWVTVLGLIFYAAVVALIVSID